MPSQSGAAYRFLLELAGSSTGPLAVDQLLPARLTQAAAAVLAVDGASLSVLSVIRASLGASNDSAAAAERLQSTLGDGPCLSAYHQAEALVADEERARRRWPVFFAELAEHTSFRSVASIPLTTGVRRFGAMDLYWDTPHIPDQDTTMDAAHTLAPLITTLLTASPAEPNPRRGVPTQAWIEAPSVRARMQVWVAIGMLRSAQTLNSADALSLLRGAAYSRGTSIDDLAVQLIDRDISVREIAN